MAQNTSLFCVDLPIYKDNITFCGILHTWTPRISQTAALMSCLVPAVLAWIFTALIIWHIFKPLYKVYKFKIYPEKREQELMLLRHPILRQENSTGKDTTNINKTSMSKESNEKDASLINKQNDSSTENIEKGNDVDLSGESISKKSFKVNDSSSFTGEKEKIYCANLCASIKLPPSIRKGFFMFTIVIFTLLKLLWDALDVTIDAYLFFQLEMGGVINSSIYRHTAINNSVLVFSVFGCMKILFWLRIFGVGRKTNVSNVVTLAPDGQKFLMTLKLLFTAVSFIFEDGPELLLEYFYVEKYMSKQITWYLLARDVILCIIALHSIVISLTWLVSYGLRLHNGSVSKYDGSKLCGAIIHGGCILFIGLSHLLRTGGAGYQYVTGKLHRSCFEITGNMLRQTPFTKGCLREVDYFIVILCCVAMLLSVFSLVTVNHLIHFAYNTRKIDRSNFWNKKYYVCC